MWAAGAVVIDVVGTVLNGIVLAGGVVLIAAGVVALVGMVRQSKEDQ